MAVTLRNLWRFLGAAGAGGVSSGARRMGLAQATVSASIRDLEEAAGARLFEPTPLGARLTSTGVGLRDHAVGLALDVEQGLSDLHAGRVGPGRAQALVLAGAPAGSWLDWAAISGALAHARRGGDRATRLALAADAPVPADGIRVGWRVLPVGEAGPPGAIPDEWRLLSAGVAADSRPVEWQALGDARLTVGPFGEAAGLPDRATYASGFDPAGPQFALTGEANAGLLIPASCLPAGLAAPGLRVQRVAGAPVAPWIVIEAAVRAEDLARAVAGFAAEAPAGTVAHPRLRSLETRIDLHCLRCFASTVETGSATRAALARGIAQPALSVQVRKLETAVKRTLFDRAAFGMAATPAGRRLYDLAAPALADHDAALARIRERARGVGDHVRIGLIPAAGEGSLVARAAVEAISDWRAAHPGVRLSVVEGFSTDQIRWLRGRVVDIALIDALDEAPGIHIRPVIREPMMLVVAPDSPWSQGGDTIEGRALSEVDLVTPSRRFGLRNLAERAFAGLGLRFEPALEVDDFAVALRLLRTARFGAILPASAVEEHIAAGRLVARRIDAPSIERRLCVATRRGDAPSPATADFGAMIERAARRLRRGGVVGASEGSIPE